MVVPEANNPRTSTDLTHQRNRGHARALANNPKATDTTEHRATRVLQRNRPKRVARGALVSGRSTPQSTAGSTGRRNAVHPYRQGFEAYGLPATWLSDDP